MDTEWIDGRLAAIHRDRKWIVAVDVAAGATGLVDLLRSWGADDVMLVAAAPGIGDVPRGLTTHYTGSTGATIMQGIRAYFASVEAPAPELQAAVDRFDPDGEAHVIGLPFGTTEHLFGRPVHGARRPQWAALEDKTVADNVWDTAGVPRAPAEIVEVAAAPAAAERLASEFGTVWAADNSHGWHGGGDATRWVPSPGEHAAMVSWFAERAERVRVMPFLDGLPCSIHGYVASDSVAAFRPIEIVILRQADRPAFIYAGVSSSWDPPPVIRAEMRHAARVVAEHLRDTYEYLGGFSIDGVCTTDGFLPTELNPRISAGLGMQASCADLALGTITRGLVSGELEVEAAFLEATIVAAADENRVAGMGLPVAKIIAPERISLSFSDAGAELAPAGDADAAVEVGPAPAGSYIRMRAETDRISIGQSIAPLAAQAAGFLSRRWRLELPPIEPAPDLCAG